MRIQLVVVGKLKEHYLKDGVAEYTKRLRPYTRLETIEVSEDKASESLSAKERELVKQREGERLIAKLKADRHVIALDIKGDELSSEQFAAYMHRLGTSGQSEVAFVIGGSLGLSQDVLDRADLRLSFSRMTFPHQLMRLILLEQIYRAFKINRGETYHK